MGLVHQIGAVSGLGIVAEDVVLVGGDGDRDVPLAPPICGAYDTYGPPRARERHRARFVFVLASIYEEAVELAPYGHTALAAALVAPKVREEAIAFCAISHMVRRHTTRFVGALPGHAAFDSRARSADRGRAS